jgi:hypothetical protein
MGHIYGGDAWQDHCLDRRGGPTFAAMMFPNCAFLPAPRFMFAVSTAIAAAAAGQAHGPSRLPRTLLLNDT